MMKRATVRSVWAKVMKDVFIRHEQCYLTTTSPFQILLSYNLKVLLTTFVYFSDVVLPLQGRSVSGDLAVQSQCEDDANVTQGR